MKKNLKKYFNHEPKKNLQKKNYKFLKQLIIICSKNYLTKHIYLKLTKDRIL